MAHTIGLFRLIRVRANATPLASVIPPRIPLSRRFELLKTSIRTFESPSQRCTRPLINYWKLHVQRYLHMTKSYNSGPPFVGKWKDNVGADCLVERCRELATSICLQGHEFSMGRLLGVSAVLGSIFLRPRFAHCMDGYDSSLDDRSIGIGGEPESDDNPHSFMIFAKKLMVPIALLLIVWMNWNHPVVLGVKVILTLLSTKPSPFSVYVFIDQMQQRYRGQHPFLHKLKSLYAKKVEVEDYTVLCIAKVEIGDQKYTLLGILGGWWVFEMTSLWSTLSDFRSRTLKILETAVSSKV